MAEGLACTLHPPQKQFKSDVSKLKNNRELKLSPFIYHSSEQEHLMITYLRFSDDLEMCGLAVMQ